MLPILTGQVGLPGTSTGMEERRHKIGSRPICPWAPIPSKAQIPVFLWTDAILRGEQMDWIHDGVKGLERGQRKLGHSIKDDLSNFRRQTRSSNQHGDCNRTDKVLRDDSKCEIHRGVRQT